MPLKVKEENEMKNKIIFGTAYYPEYMPYDRVEEDLIMMKETGMNVIRIAESTWSTLEPKDGIYDFSYIDRTLEAARKYDMEVIIGTPTYAIPSWLVGKEPSVMVEQKRGKAVYGHRQLMDITNPVFLHYAERIIRKLMEHTVDHPRVIGFQIDNETKHYDVYSDLVQKRFVEFLKERYGSVENLNKAFYLAYWSNSIHSWEDFPDMRGCVHGGLAGEYDRFRRDLVTEYLKWQSDIVGEYAKETQFVTHNLDFEWKKFGADIAQDGYSYGVQPDVNHGDVADYLDVTGTDIYHPTQDDLTGVEIAFCGDEIRCLKDDNYLVLENQAQAFKYWTPYPGQLRQHAYSHLASGAFGTMYWNWHSIHNGYETYWKGVLSHDLGKNPVYDEAARIGKEWKELGSDHLLIETHNEVALVIDNASLTAFKWFPIDKDLSYNDVVRFMYDSLYEMNIECDVVFADRLQVEKYKMIVIPALYCCSEKLLYELENFVAEGGTLISSFKSFVADEHTSVYASTQPHILHKCFGVSYNQFTEPGTMKIDDYPVKYWAELLTVDSAKVISAYEHPYWKRYAGITENHFCKGYAYYFGCFTDKEVLKKLYNRAAKKAGIPLLQVEAPVIVRSGKNRSGAMVHYLFHYDKEEKEIICPYPKAVDILSKKVYAQGDVIVLSDWDIKILEEIV